ncbi:hypothetical protein A8B82_06945 [Sulfitobacter sp. EhC04]|uniref:pyridoxal-phosphate-dependent aminotransferase family protein n=1 Tax=Sulfitobacter sp. EhC04 TaxID=1849168 RepID=UPI0007F3A931|nr:aminotransferase class V-fold PLP-dependent enzyme [Sulfitobacter sp. EhC04]MAY86068.1 aminotransferase class V-fold PLP-dependent enzyme [Pseudooceanicola sp.]OAN80143.1 hypothetical protein A8B82_06945 [Sulfitobacter sp. EhC04]
MPGINFLHTPGPTHIPQSVLNAMSRQPLDFVDSRFEDLVRECFEELPPLFDTDGEVFLYASNGHGAWEATTRNLIGPNDQVLMLETGFFSQRWVECTEMLGVQTTVLKGEPGLAVDPSRITETLGDDKDHSIRAVYVAHTDTASGVRTDLAEVRAAIDAANHPALLVVDAIASFAAEPLSMADTNIDVVVVSVQKGMMLPPGMSLTAVSGRALERSATLNAPNCYWSWKERQKELVYQKFCGTPPTHMLFGLRQALHLIKSEGLTQIQDRHALLGGFVRDCVSVWTQSEGIDFYAREPSQRSNSVTPVIIDQPDAMAEAARVLARTQLDVSVAGGFGPTAGKMIRIGHLGDMNLPMIIGCLGTLEAAMHQSGVQFRSGLDDALRKLPDFTSGNFSLTEG